MKLKEGALVAEIVGAFAIVISLIFVGLQVRHSAQETALNTNAIKAEAYQSLTAHILSLNSDIYLDEQLAALMLRGGLGDGEPLSDVEEFQFDRFLTYLLAHGDLSYYLYQQGVLDEERLRNIVGQLLVFSRTETFQRYWEERNLASRVAPEFVTYIKENGFGNTEVTPE